MPMATRSLVCVINRNRDAYQVPLALAEAGLLKRFVTDFYAPAGAWARFLPGPLRRRRIDGLPRRQTTSVWPSFVVQAAAHLLKVGGSRTFSVTDRMLARVAAKTARRAPAGLYCYHSYVPEKVEAGHTLIIFAYHPMPGAEIRVLEADARIFPEIVPAWARERIVLAREPKIDWDRADAVVCASSFTAASLVTDGCAAAKIAVIPYGSPYVAAADLPLRQPGTATEFLFVGQGVQRKGLHHLIRAWQADPPSGARLTIVSYRIEPEIAAMIRHPSIRLAGYQPRDELARLFAKADVFVMPSLIEGFGLVYCEALAHGCHVIGTRNTGLPDLGLDDEAVTLVEAGDLEQLSQALHSGAVRARAGAFDRGGIAAHSRRWTQAHFRRAIGEHAERVMTP